MTRQEPEGSSGREYRGEDRRGSGVVEGSSLGPAFLTAAVVLGFMLALFGLGPWFLEDQQVVEPFSLSVQLDAAGFAIALVLGALCLQRWRLIGDAPAFWLGWAALVYGVVAIGIGSLVPLIAPQGMDVEVLGWMRPAGRAVVAILLVRGIASPNVDAGIRTTLVGPAIVAMLAMLTLTFQLLPVLARPLASAADAPHVLGDSALGSVVLVCIWLGLAWAAFVRSHRTGHPLLAWFGLMLAAFTSVEILQLLSLPADSLWAAGPASLRSLGLLVALCGALLGLHRAYLAQGGRLLDSVTSELTAEARIQAGHAALAERAHEARNALTAIEGATRTLEHYRDKLDDDARASLTAAISQEIARLQRLVSEDTSPTELVPFSIAEAISSVVTASRSLGSLIEVEVPPDLQAYGRPVETAQVIQNLLENARRYAAASPIAIRAQPQGDGVVVRVEDRGQGVPPEERMRIFRRGQRGSTSTDASGSGLGLYVSTRLMHEQGGELWVEERAGGGASFALWLSAREPVAGGDAAVDESDHAVQPIKVRPLRSRMAADLDDAARPRRRRHSQPDVR